MCSGFAGKKSANNAPAALCGHKAPFQKTDAGLCCWHTIKNRPASSFLCQTTVRPPLIPFPKRFPLRQSAPRRSLKMIIMDFSPHVKNERQQHTFFVPAGRKTLCPARIVGKGDRLAERRAPPRAKNKNCRRFSFSIGAIFAVAGFPDAPGRGRRLPRPPCFTKARKRQYRACSRCPFPRAIARACRAR